MILIILCLSSPTVDFNKKQERDRAGKKSSLTGVIEWREWGGLIGQGEQKGHWGGQAGQSERRKSAD